MGNKTITIVYKQQLCAKHVPPPQVARGNRRKRTLRHWQAACASKAQMWDADGGYYLFRFGGRWNLLNVFSRDVIKSFPGDAKEAAELVLLMRATGGADA